MGEPDEGEGEVCWTGFALLGLRIWFVNRLFGFRWLSAPVLDIAEGVDPLRRVIRAAAFGAVLFHVAAVAADPPHNPQSWTMRDLNRVAEAAFDAVPGNDHLPSRASDFIKLGDALTGAGNLAPARSTFLEAAVAAEKGKLGSFQVDAIGKLARLGDVDDAQRLLGSVTDEKIRARAQARIDGVRSGLPEPTPAAQQPSPQLISDLELAKSGEAARRLLRQGDRPAAREGALRASELALADAGNHPEWPSDRHIQHQVHLGRISSLLAEVGAYDEAVATAQPIEAVSRRQYYIGVVESAARAHDKAAVDRLLPGAIAALKAPSPDWGTLQSLHRTIRSLAVLGYRDAAREAFAEFQASREVPDAAGHLHPPDPGMIAECQAVTGDLAGALATVETLGPLVEPPGPLTAAMATVMSFGGAQTPPSQAELAARLAEVKKLLPPLRAGGKAHVLSKITVDLAEMGDIDKAIDIEARLEAEPRDVLAQLRDRALAATSKAQQEAGELRISLATALRISERHDRFEQLLQLARVPPRP
ncbi:MAG: hypothetical protein JO204_11780 [Alphaproteobacteria bacterium]|nr:hypothetical protein [Alphaproteobacteria bacterium]